MSIGELGRQTIHIISGLLIMLLLVVYGRESAMFVVFFCLLLISLIVNQRFQGRGVFIFDWFEKKFERAGTRFPWWGPTFYLLGVLLSIVFLQDLRYIVASIYILAVGDGFSTLVGIKGSHPMPFTNKKSIEGTTAFFISCLPLYMLLSWAVVPVAIIAALVEAYSFSLEDNLTIPLACVIIFRLFF